MPNLHVLWLEFLSWSPIIYLNGPGLYGGFIPLLFSILFLSNALRQYRKSILSRTSYSILILFFWLLCLTISWCFYRWGAIGLHAFPTPEIVWPILALVLREPALTFLSYPLAFTSTLIVDVYAAGQNEHWVHGFWFGVGGAGFHDALFLTPLFTFVLTSGAYLLSKRLHASFGLFAKPRGR